MPFEDVGDGVLADAEVQGDPTAAPRPADGTKHLRGEPGPEMLTARRRGTLRGTTRSSGKVNGVGDERSSDCPKHEAGAVDGGRVHPRGRGARCWLAVAGVV